MTVPFTYLVTDTETGMRYYGARWARECHPSQLGVSYFTTSRVMLQLFKEYGIQRFVFEVRKVFSDGASARAWESKFLTKVNAANSLHWYNRHNGSVGFATVSSLSEDHRMKMSASMTGRIANNKGIPRSEETKLRISKSLKGKTLGVKKSVQTRERMSRSQFGRLHTDESKQKMRDAKLKRNVNYGP